MPATQHDQSACEQDSRNTEDRATGIMVVTPLRPFATPLLHAMFWLAGHVPGAKRKLEKLSFIHYARWSVLSAVPDNGLPQQPVRLHNRYLFFESSFNGTWDESIDAFSEIVPLVYLWYTFGIYAPSGAPPTGSSAHARSGRPRTNDLVRNRVGGVSCRDTGGTTR